MLLKISQLTRDAGLQPRAQLDEETIERYRALILEDHPVNAVRVFHDGQNHFLTDGYHRVEAHVRAGKDEVDAVIVSGSFDDALWDSYAANRENGLSRSEDDVERQVSGAIKNFSAKSDREIALHVGCSRSYVQKLRGSILPQCGKIAEPEPKIRTVTRNGTTYQQNTSNIGRAPAAPAPDPYRRVAPMSTPHPERKIDSSKPLISPLGSTKINYATRKFGDPWPPKKEIIPEDETADLVKAIKRIATHGISAAEMIKLLPEEGYEAAHENVTKALEFMGFLAEHLGKKLVRA